MRPLSLEIRHGAGTRRVLVNAALVTVIESSVDGIGAQIELAGGTTMVVPGETAGELAVRIAGAGSGEGTGADAVTLLEEAVPTGAAAYALAAARLVERAVDVVGHLTVDDARVPSDVAEVVNSILARSLLTAALEQLLAAAEALGDSADRGPQGQAGAVLALPGSAQS